MAAYDAAEGKPAKAATPRQEPPAASDRGGKGGHAGDRRGDWYPAAGSAASGHRGGRDNRWSWNAGNQSGGKSEWSSKGDRKGKRGHPVAPRSPEKRVKRL